MYSWNRHSNRKHDDKLINHGTFFGTLFSDTPAYTYIINYIYIYNIHIIYIYTSTVYVSYENSYRSYSYSAGCKHFASTGDHQVGWFTLFSNGQPLRKSFGTKRRSGWSTFSTSAEDLVATFHSCWIGLMVGTLPYKKSAGYSKYFEVVWVCLKIVYPCTQWFCWSLSRF